MLEYQYPDFTKKDEMLSRGDLHILTNPKAKWPPDCKG